MTKTQKRKPEHAPEDLRDTRGGTYDVDPAFAKEGQGEYGGHPPEGLTREPAHPLNRKTGRRPEKE